jgi:hypothetical protein
VYKDCYDNHLGYIDPLTDSTRCTISNFWEMTEQGNKTYVSILDKYQLVLISSGSRPLARGQALYQDADTLIRVRNELMHYKPESLGGDNLHKLEARLRGKFSENKLMEGSGNPFFPDKALGKGCTDWVIASVKRFADNFFTTLGIAPNYRQVSFG